MTFADMVEEMMKGLTAVSWERVDVKFGGGKHRLIAHNSIQASCTFRPIFFLYNMCNIRIPLQFHSFLTSKNYFNLLELIVTHLT